MKQPKKNSALHRNSDLKDKIGFLTKNCESQKTVEHHP